MPSPADRRPRHPRAAHHLAIVILLFGASKLPELARGSGRALRIFKAETKGMADDEDDDDQKTTSQLELEARQAAEREATATRPVEPPVEHHDDTTA